MAAIAFLRPTRANFQLSPTEDEAEALARHFAFLQGLVAAGKVVLAGPATDGSLGLVVFPHASEAEARELVAGDPCVVAGVMEAEVKPFRMSLFGTGTGRDWLGFTQAIHVRTDAASAWRMVATCDGLERWFVARADAWTHDGREWPRDRALEQGARVRLTWRGAGESDDRGRCAPAEQTEDDDVLRTEAPQRIRTGWYENKGWVEFRLMPRADGRVTVELEQRMHPTSDFRLLEGAYTGCREGWAFYLANLKCVLEHGIDLRERAPDRKQLVNV
jgi:uncharacterized protein YciI/uncharacterized protein YndB with AHSA1/START domain